MSWILPDPLDFKPSKEARTVRIEDSPQNLKARIRKRRWIKRNPEKYEAQKERRAAVRRKWYAQNRDKELARIARWQRKNKDRRNEKSRERYASDPIFRAAALARKIATFTERYRNDPAFRERILQRQRDLRAKAKAARDSVRHDLQVVRDLDVLP